MAQLQAQRILFLGNLPNIIIIISRKTWHTQVIISIIIIWWLCASLSSCLKKQNKKNKRASNAWLVIWNNVQKNESFDCRHHSVSKTVQHQVLLHFASAAFSLLLLLCSFSSPVHAVLPWNEWACCTVMKEASLHHQLPPHFFGMQVYRDGM